MQFVLIIYHGTSPLPGSAGWKALTEPERQRMYADYAEINQEPCVTLPLPPLAPGKVTTVQVRDGRVESKSAPHLSESIGGAFVFEAENIESAIALAARIPQARMGGAVEIRPVEKYF
ncbi:MAG TPA: YciI family protein [Polyangiaceae bacterium]|nr:YciI family protein [Polyangiaceae bacterium]